MSSAYDIVKLQAIFHAPSVDDVEVADEVTVVADAQVEAEAVLETATLRQDNYWMGIGACNEL
jgi:hypothetical protein